MDLSQVTYIGKTDFRNQLTQFGIRAKDRFRHMYIIGKSGTGKTTLIENMLVQDIYNGNGVAFIDPHGESADKLLRYIPSSRINDVIYFNPGDSEFPVAFNPMEIGDNASASERSLITDGLMTVFKKIWPDAFSGRMEYILNNTMLALLENPEPSLLGINRMLTDKEYRKKMIAGVTDPTVRNAWDELMKWDDKRWSEAIGALVNKIGQFTTNPVVRNIIGQAKSTFSFRQVMDEKKILIMNMSKGLIGDQSAALLGAMLITKIYLAGMSRANMTSEELERAAPLYFYVDEFQNFANDSFANILSEARKYKLALIVANQYIAQMEETIRDAVFGNMGTTVTFRVGPLDAEFIERVYTPVFNAQDLQNIAFGQIFLTLLIDGLSSKPFSALTLLPIQPKEEPQKDLVIETSRKQFARPREQVEEKIMAWFIQQRDKADNAAKGIKPSESPKDPAISGTGTARNFIAPTVPHTTPKIIIPQTANSDRSVVKTPEKQTRPASITSQKPVISLPQKPVQKPNSQVNQKPKPIPVVSNTEKAFQTKAVLDTGIVSSLDNLFGSETDEKPSKKIFTSTPESSRDVPQKSAQKPPLEKSTVTEKVFTPPVKNLPQKPLNKAAKADTKSSLGDVLKRVAVMQKSLAEERKSKDIKRVDELQGLLGKYKAIKNIPDVPEKQSVQQHTVHTSPAPTPVVAPKLLTSHERLHSIFASSELVRGSDDLPVQSSVHKPKEVPEDVLQSIFQNV